jgi:hypothetical protein
VSGSLRTLAEFEAALQQHDGKDPIGRGARSVCAAHLRPNKSTKFLKKIESDLSNLGPQPHAKRHDTVTLRAQMPLGGGDFQTLWERDRR